MLFGIIIAGISGLAVLGAVSGTVAELISQSKARKNAATNNVEVENSDTKNRQRKKVVTEEVEETVEENKTPVVDDITVEQAVAQKMATPQVKKLVGRNAAKAAYLSKILTTMGNAQASNKKSVSALFNHESMDKTIIPNACNRIDQYLNVYTQATEALKKFEDTKGSNIQGHVQEVYENLKNLETYLVTNDQKAFNITIKMVESGLKGTVATMSSTRHMSEVMAGVAGLRKRVDNLEEKMEQVDSKLEEYGYDFKMLEKLDLVDLKKKVDGLQNKGLDNESVKLIFAACISNYVESDEFNSYVQNIVQNTQVKVTTKITKNARESIVKEIYNVIIKDGTMDKDMLNTTIRKIVTEIIENDLKVTPQKR